jgi:hypothetical protein
MISEIVLYTAAAFTGLAIYGAMMLIVTEVRR